MTTKHNIKVLDGHVVLWWDFNCENPDCTLCKTSLLAPPPQNFDTTKNTSTIEGIVTVGTCGHMFHSTCISAHLKNTACCPIDKLTWTISKNLKSGAIMPTSDNVTFKK